MNWYKNLYTGESAKKKKRKLMRKLDAHKLVLGAYVITLAANGKDMFDMLPSYMLFREENAERLILGLAANKEEAMEVCGKMLEDVYSGTGGYDVRSYFS